MIRMSFIRSNHMQAKLRGCFSAFGIGAYATPLPRIEPLLFLPVMSPPENQAAWLYGVEDLRILPFTLPDLGEFGRKKTRGQWNQPSSTLQFALTDFAQLTKVVVA